MYTLGVRRPLLIFAAAMVTAVGGGAVAQPSTAVPDLLDKATAYVSEYEKTLSLLVSEEFYVQEVRRPLNPGANLSRANPGGGMQGGCAQPPSPAFRLPARAARARGRVDAVS